MKTVTIGRTAYKINDARDIFAEHAKCTGKHKIVKSRGAELRRFPDYWADMSTADYVAMYYGLNSTASRFPSAKGAPYGTGNTLAGFYENLNTAPAANYTEGDIYMKTKDNLHPLMREIIAPWAPLTYADHYYVDLGYRYERGQVSEHEYKMAIAEGPEARRLMERGAMEAMRSAY